MNTVVRIRTIAQYSMLEGLRGQVFLIAAAILLAIVLLAEFSGQLVLTDTWQTKVSIYAFLARLAVVALISIYIINSLVRDRIEKQTEWLLSTDMPRIAYLLGRTAGFVIVSMMAVILFSLYPLLYVTASSAIAWAATLAAEILVVTLLTVFVVITLNNTVTSFIIVSAFYLLARNMGNLILIAQSNIVAGEGNLMDMMQYAIKAVHYILPDLWRYADTRWLIYNEGSASALMMITAETVIYSLLLLSAAAFDLYRKDFTESFD